MSLQLLSSYIYTLKFGQYSTSFCVANSSVSKCPICSFCSSDRGFASNFLQTPHHDGRPCLLLTVPTAKPIADFHSIVIMHAENITKDCYSLHYLCCFSGIQLVILTLLLNELFVGSSLYNSSSFKNYNTIRIAYR